MSQSGFGARRFGLFRQGAASVRGNLERSENTSLFPELKLSRVHVCFNGVEDKVTNIIQ